MLKRQCDLIQEILFVITFNKMFHLISNYLIKNICYLLNILNKQIFHFSFVLHFFGYIEYSDERFLNNSIMFVI